MFIVRPESPDDQQAVFLVNRAAFGREAEARLVDALRLDSAFIPELSFVAVEGSQVVGHILFTRVAVRDGDVVRSALALAPMAVSPAFQRQGVGTAMVRRGLNAARAIGHRVVIVLGHPHYYPRFGFRPAEPMGIQSPFPAPTEAFLVLGLDDGALSGFKGLVEYSPPFGQM